MKTIKVLMTTFITLVCISLFMLGIFASDTDTVFFKVFIWFWLFICCILLPNMALIHIERNFNKDLEEIKRQERVKGAKMFLDQVTSTNRFKEVTNKDVPLINTKGEKYGTGTVYTDLSTFLNNDFKA